MNWPYYTVVKNKRIIAKMEKVDYWIRSVIDNKTYIRTFQNVLRVNNASKQHTT